MSLYSILGYEELEDSLEPYYDPILSKFMVGVE